MARARLHSPRRSVTWIAYDPAGAALGPFKAPADADADELFARARMAHPSAARVETVARPGYQPVREVTE